MNPVEIAKFGGLNLAGDPQEAGASAIDGMDFTVSADGRVGSRYGYSQLVGSITNKPSILYRTAGGSSVSFVFSNSLPAVADAGVSQGGITIYNAAGATVATNAGFAYDFVRMGTPGDGFVYIAAGAQLNKVTMSTNAFSNVAAYTGFGGAYGVAVTPWDSRLAVNTGQSVVFSDPGDGTTFPANNFETLDPNDGESGSAIVSWRDMLFVFRASKFWVFYGTSIDTDGNPIFQFRKVEGMGVVATSGNHRVVATHKDGVYFLGRDGVYVTTGGVPQKVSQALDPWFRGESLPFWTGPVASSLSTNGLSRASVGIADNRLYVTPSRDLNLTFVMDLTTNQWSAYSWAAWGYCPFIETSQPTDSLLVSHNSKLGIHKVGQTTDASTSITGTYQTGFMNLGQPMGESVVREYLFDGTGTVATSMAVNDSATLGSSATVTFGSSVSRQTDRRATKARNVSVKFNGSLWQVKRMVMDVRSQRESGLKAT